MPTLTKPPQLDATEARRILANPDLCATHPSLRRIAFFVAKSALGKPARQIMRRSGPLDAA